METHNKSAPIHAGWNPTRETRGRPRDGLYIQSSRTFISQVTGIPRPTISAILNGRRGCSLSKGLCLAGALGISTERLERDLKVVRARRKG